jgi:hypothetical protein
MGMLDHVTSAARRRLMANQGAQPAALVLSSSQFIAAERGVVLLRGEAAFSLARGDGGIGTVPGQTVVSSGRAYAAT